MWQKTGEQNTALIDFVLSTSDVTHNNEVIFIKISVYVPNSIAYKCIFQVFHTLKINRMMPFRNLFRERSSYYLLPSLQLELSLLPVFTARRSYASAVLGVVILSVCHTRALWLIQRIYWQCFYTTWKDNPSSLLPPNSGWWATSPST